MKFCEAMDKLKAGAKVTRHPWSQGVYFLMDGNDVKSYQPKLSPYNYNEDIMVSDGWFVDDHEEEMKFCDIIPFLQNGSKAKQRDWKEMFVYLDQSARSLVVHSMDIFPFIPDFDSFTAQDWIEVE
jgi:hypothetical protein